MCVFSAFLHSLQLPLIHIGKKKKRKEKGGRERENGSEFVAETIVQLFLRFHPLNV